MKSVHLVWSFSTQAIACIVPTTLLSKLMSYGIKAVNTLCICGGAAVLYLACHRFNTGELTLFSWQKTNDGQFIFQLTRLFFTKPAQIMSFGGGICMSYFSHHCDKILCTRKRYLFCTQFQILIHHGRSCMDEGGVESVPMGAVGGCLHTVADKKGEN